MADRAFNFSTGGPRSQLPKDPTIETPPRPGGQAERPLGPQPGIDLIDQMCVNADRRERQQAMQPDLLQAATTMLQVQSQQIGRWRLWCSAERKIRRPNHE